MTVSELDKWHKTRTGNLVFGLIELLLAYGAASWAIDNGSVWLYILTIVFVIGGVKNLVSAARLHGKAKK